MAYFFTFYGSQKSHMNTQGFLTRAMMTVSGFNAIADQCNPFF